MGKLTPPPVVRINIGEAACTFDQLAASYSALLNATRPHVRVCSQYGAPLHSDKCDYCGAEYKKED